jgi:hypothetical protein
MYLFASLTIILVGRIKKDLSREYPPLEMSRRRVRPPSGSAVHSNNFGPPPDMFDSSSAFVEITSFSRVS